jgi:outer membrane receptor protein involved in Fe transport
VLSDAFTLSGSMNWIDTEFSGGPGFPAATPGLPVAPDFKANLIGRYTFELAGLPAYAQGVLVHASEAGVDLRETEAAIIGNLPSYTMIDLSFGFDAASFTLDFYVHNLTDERAIYARGSECQISVCGGQPYDAVAQPRTYGLKFGQRF